MYFHTTSGYFVLLFVCIVDRNFAETEDVLLMERDSDFGGVGDEFLQQCMHTAKENVNRAIRRTKIHWKKDHIWDTPMHLFQFFKRPPTEEAERIARSGDIFETTVNYIQDKIRKNHKRLKRRVNATDVLSAETIMELAKFAGCKPNMIPMTCTNDCFTKRFRALNGECNNVEHRYWGASNNPLVRWIPSQYENDFNLPMGWDEDKLRNNFTLPLVRKLSNEVIHTSNENVTDDDLYSHLLVVWGQYIDHDIDFTPQSLSTSTFQGLTNCKETCANEPPCFPIKVPKDDPRVTTAECFPFFRSAAVCGTGETSGLFNKLLPREQINAVTSFVDASTVYGSNGELGYRLRDLGSDEGLMRINDRYTDNGREYLPFDPNNPCVQDQSDASGESIPCFLAGDGRVSEHQTLAVIHTIWLREHNRLAKELKKINPHWKGERIYQEARKIVGSLHQIVQYKEYVPKIIGEEGVQMMGEYSGFDPEENPSVSNVFATAAFRFGHVTIAPIFRRLNERYEEHEQYGNILLHQAFFATWRVINEGGLDPILRGLIGRPAKLVTPNQIMHEELREKLFKLQNKIALDLASLNLQRGRDHALPLYNDWREFCNYSRAETFDDMSIRDPVARRKLEELYGHPGNVDLWLAGLMEDLIEGSRVGPIFRCLLAKQFKLQRNGDRFFYGNEGVHTAAQLEALENIRFSNVICANSGVQMVQRDVFAMAEYPDGFMECSNVESLNIEPWREDPNIGSCGTPPNVTNAEWFRCDVMNKVTYMCNMGFVLEGAKDLTCQDNGNFDYDPPICADINECEDMNGGCEYECVNTDGSYNCKCKEYVTLNEDGKTCSQPPGLNATNTEEEPVNVPAIITGVILGLAIVGIVAVSAYGIYKYMSLRSSVKMRHSPKYKISDGVIAETIHNPGVTNAPAI